MIRCMRGVFTEGRDLYLLEFVYLTLDVLMF